MTDRVRCGLDWITAHLTGFAPSGRGRTRVKPLGELAMVFAYLTKWGVAVPPRWREFVTAACVGDDLLADARADRRDGLYLMQPYAWLRSTGVRDPAAERVVRELWAAGAQPTSIGQIHSLWKGGFVRTTPDWDGFCRTQVLDRNWTNATLARETYRVTHAVFYATDLGGRATALDRAERHSIAAVLREVARLARERGHWDRLAETAIALRSLGGVVLDADTDPGDASVQSARFADGAFPRNAGVHASTFADCYHATLVDLLDGTFGVPVHG